MPHHTLPMRSAPGLAEFCRTISPERPVFIRSRPPKDAQQWQCFDNVARKVQRAGGSIAYGWAVWHLPGVYFEAEHHGVWKRKTGELLDVSPQWQGYGKILFVPDPGAVYDPAVFRPNRVTADGEDPRSLAITELMRERYSLLAACRARGMIGHDAVTQEVEHTLLRRIGALLAELKG